MESKYGINRFYTSVTHMSRVFDKYARRNGLKAETKEEYLGWKDRTRRKLIELIGLDRMEMCPLKPIVKEKVIVEDGITREKVLIQVEPDVWMPMFILIPEKCQNNKEAECYIAPCGHMGGGKYSIAGVKGYPEIDKQIEVFNYDYGMQLAKLGYVALCPDSRGFGERRDLNIQADEDFFKNSCFNLAHMAEPLGQTVIGMCTWDLMRLIDYIYERDEWNSSNISCLGFSGGGMQTLWLTALDDRITKAVISGYMYGFKDSLLELNNNCSCNYIPHLWENYDCGDIGALIAPRPLIIQSCRQDHLNGKRGVINAVEQVEIIRKAYAVMNAEELVKQDLFDGEHKWHSENIKEYVKFGR